MAKKTVYHGTFSGQAPHEYGGTFHAGTLRATDDRAADQLMGGDVEAPAIRQVHAYEISDDSPVSKRVWGDPDVGFLRATWERDGEDGPPTPEVPEHKTNRIYPYKNMREDTGSTAYVIPSGFVGKHVKHLGVQFQGLHGSDEQHDAVMGAISSMAGGPFKQK
jgi:hypothetical protein